MANKIKKINKILGKIIVMSNLNSMFSCTSIWENCKPIG